MLIIQPDVVRDTVILKTIKRVITVKFNAYPLDPATNFSAGGKSVHINTDTVQFTVFIVYAMCAMYTQGHVYIVAN